ncbi:hypothetical protein BDV93DRAFT_179763 [Ceratobasidium sp. AG-I]|nr:hypothetical protein BDV93DRAFT_179763 [Ceratobasidium sp. AG-I]
MHPCSDCRAAVAALDSDQSADLKYDNHHSCTHPALGSACTCILHPFNPSIILIVSFCLFPNADSTALMLYPFSQPSATMYFPLASCIVHLLTLLLVLFFFCVITILQISYVYHFLMLQFHFSGVVHFLKSCSAGLSFANAPTGDSHPEPQRRNRSTGGV